MKRTEGGGAKKREKDDRGERAQEKEVGRACSQKILAQTLLMIVYFESFFFLQSLIIITGTLHLLLLPGSQFKVNSSSFASGIAKIK